MRYSSEVAREAIEKFESFEDRVAYIQRELPHLKRQSAVKALRRALDKEADTVDTGADSVRDTFEFDEEHYYFELGTNTPFYVPNDEIQSWVRWYVTDGCNVTQRTVTRMSWQINDRPLTKDFARRIFKCLGIDKSSPPFAPHMLQKHSAEELEKLHFATAQADIETRIRASEPKEWRQNWMKAEKRAAELQGKLNSYSEQAAALAAKINRTAPTNIAVEFEPTTDDAILIPTYDVHVGKRCIDGTDSVDAAMQAHAALYARIAPTCPGNIILVFGGDFFHVDNAQGTYAGTPQDIDDGWPEIIHKGWNLAEAIIELWRKTGASIEVFVVPGNHDRGGCHHLSAGLSRLYRNVPSVKMHLSHREMQATTFGKVLLVFEHGDGPKEKDLTKVIANKWPVLWGKTIFRIIVTGHLHHVYEHDVGVLVLQQPSSSGIDEYHEKKGYTYSKRAMRAYTLSKTKGHIMTWIYNFGA